MNIQQLFNELKRLSESPSSSNNKEDNIEMLIPPEKQKQIFKESSQKQHTNLSCWNAYLNHLCLEAFQEIILEELDISSKSLTIPASEELAVFWEFVNGTPIRLNDISVLLIPHETTELEQIEVPQEWIDIPSLAADYYIAFQVESEIDSLDNSEEDSFDFASIELVGVTTHQTLKQKGQYDQSKRNYCLDVRHLFSLNVMRTSQQINLQVSTPILDLPALSKNRKNDLFSILSKDSPTSPRLDVSFEEWGALFEDKAWRTKLYETRITLNNIVPIITRWLERNFTLGIELGWKPEPELTPVAVRSRFRQTKNELEERLNNSTDEQEILELAEKLGKLDWENPIVINSLVHLLNNTLDQTNRWNAALTLGQIAPDHINGAICCYKMFDFDSHQLKLRIAARYPSLSEKLSPSTVLLFLQPQVVDEEQELFFHDLQLLILDQERQLVAQLSWTELPVELNTNFKESLIIQLKVKDTLIEEILEI